MRRSTEHAARPRSGTSTTVAERSRSASNSSLGGMVVVIGGMKCGTSSLHQYLDAHPDIAMSKRKELNFFVLEKRWSRGFEWYRKQFDYRPKWRGESSPNYTKYPTFNGVPERMASLIPHAKLIYVLRDPLERTVSHYIHNLSDGREHRNVNDALADPRNNHYVQTSCYHLQLQRYLEHFPEKNLLTILAKDLREHRMATMQEAFQFLELRPDVDESALAKVLHESRHKRQPTETALRLPGGKVLRKALPFWLERPLEPPKLSEVVSTRLKEVFHEDTEKLRAVTGHQFASWCV